MTALAAAGAGFQGLLSNPLADPHVLGPDHDVGGRGTARPIPP